MQIPAVALLSETGEVTRSTDSFRQNYGGLAEALVRDPGIEQVLRGHQERSSVTIDNVAVEAEAVSDRSGARLGLVTLRPADAPEGDNQTLENPLLGERFDDSSVLVWLKDLSGKYLLVNQPYTDLLGTSEERFLGKTAAEMTPREVVDGPRPH